MHSAHIYARVWDAVRTGATHQGCTPRIADHMALHVTAWPVGGAAGCKGRTTIQEYDLRWPSTPGHVHDSAEYAANSRDSALLAD